MLLVCLICSMMRQIQTNNNHGVSEIVFYVCYLIISILMLTEFGIIMNLCKDTILILNGFNGVFVPIMMIFMGLSGGLITASTLQTSIMIFIAVLSNITALLWIPIIMATTIMGMVSNISDIIDVSKIATFIKKLAIWFVEVAMIIFVSLLTLEGSLSQNVDNVTSKTAKSIVSNAVPVVGKLIRRCCRKYDWSGQAF